MTEARERRGPSVAVGRRESVGGVLAAPVLPTINLVRHPSSISLPSRGGVRREKEELKE